MTVTERAIAEIIAQLDEAQQIKSEIPQGIFDEDLIALVHSLHFDPQDVELMAQAIEEDCERIEADDGHFI